MQEPDQRDRHDSAGVARSLLVAAAVALLCAAAARAGAPRQAALPSPVAPLSAAPPLGGATASAETAGHRIAARVAVDVSVDGRGTPFAVVATQRLDVRGTGDYSFAIGAPVLDVRAAEGSAVPPGFRSGAILWAGFDPGRRLLAARATLDPARARPALPLRVVPGAGRTTLVNATETVVDTYTADARRQPLLAYLAKLRSAVAQGLAPAAGFATVTSEPKAAELTVRAPLHVTGTIGGRRVDLELERQAVVPSGGAVDLRVAPVQRVETRDLSRLDGRALLATAIRASLELARARQYEAFLGNPDPAGTSRTTYAYRTARRRAPPPVAVAPTRGRSPFELALIAVAAAAGLVAVALLWARS